MTRNVYPGLRHETLNEPEGPAVVADMIAWLRAQVGCAGDAVGTVAATSRPQRSPVLDSAQSNNASGERGRAESVARPQTRRT